ncbi:MAG: acyl-CoA thioesterase [Anaerolineae bacterium]|nr:acyl-CoA thioesterase [Anaerolineae bacterium]
MKLENPDVVETTFHVRYAETDAMGIVHHASYIVWFEEGRSAWGRAKGLPYNDFEAAGFFLALTDVHARYATPALYGQRVTVRTRLSEVRSRSLAFAYEIVNADTGALCVSGTTRHICVTREGKPTRLPDTWKVRLGAA